MNITISQEASDMASQEKRTARRLDRALKNVAQTDKLWEDAGKLGEPGTEESAAYLAGYDIDPVSAAMSAREGAGQVLSTAEEARAKHIEASRSFYERNANELHAQALGEASLAGVHINRPDAS